MRLQKSSLLVMAILFSLSVLVGCSSSQSSTDLSSIEGVLVSPDSVPSAQATVTLYSEDSFADSGTRAQELASTSTNEFGYYYFGGLSKGAYALVSDADYGVVELRDLDLSSIRALDLGDISLLTPDQVSGSATIIEGSSSQNAGIDVFIPGTSYASKTDTDGEYVISGITPGTYSVFFIKHGYSLIQISDVVVVTNESTHIDDQALIVDDSFTSDVSDGVDGDAGSDGSDGEDEPFWFVDAGVPDDGSGIEGDYYLDTDSIVVYIKTSEAWVSENSIEGDVGDDGAQGDQGDEGFTPELLAAGVMKSDLSFEISEGASDILGLRLTALPLDDVVISLSLTDPGFDATLDIESVTFTTSNWMLTQNVTISAVGDESSEGSEIVTINFSLSSYDIYNGQSVASVPVVITD